MARSQSQTPRRQPASAASGIKSGLRSQTMVDPSGSDSNDSARDESHKAQDNLKQQSQGSFQAHSSDQGSNDTYGSEDLGESGKDRNGGGRN
ncbi:hypothetical protein GGF37_005951, partial [Kickxella alabastrina]